MCQTFHGGQRYSHEFSMRSRLSGRPSICLHEFGGRSIVFLEKIMTKLPDTAFFTPEEKVQLLSGDCPRNITRDRLKEWLSYRKGSSKDGSARSDSTKKELVLRYYLKC